MAKEKIPGAMHPLVAANRAKPKAMGVFIVWDKDGRPKLEVDFIIHLNATQRAKVDEQLAARGFRINTENLVEEIV